jgi:hypothetical protein
LPAGGQQIKKSLTFGEVFCWPLPAMIVEERTIFFLSYSSNYLVKVDSMKTVFSILLSILFPAIVLSQTSNRYNDHNAKVGMWIETDPAENTTKTGTCIAKKRKRSAEEIFTGNIIDFNKEYDSIWISVRVGEWVTFDANRMILQKQFYDEQGKLQWTDQYDITNPKSSYVKRYSPKSNLCFVPLGFDSVAFDLNRLPQKYIPAGEFFSFPVNITNLTDHPIDISLVQNTSLSIATEPFILRPRETKIYVVELKVLGGETRDDILFETKGWKYPIQVSVFGFHLSSNDFDSPQLKILPAKFYYYRDAEEYQLEIVTQKGAGKVLPLSKIITPIQLTPGEYFFRIAFPSGKKEKKVTVR